MDTMQLNKSKNGYTYVLLLCEEFSGYIVATPLKTLQAVEAVKALRTLFVIYHYPELLEAIIHHSFLMCK